MKFKVQINGQQKPITAKNPKIDQNKDNICWIPYGQAARGEQADQPISGDQVEFKNSIY